MSLRCVTGVVVVLPRDGAGEVFFVARSGTVSTFAVVAVGEVVVVVIVVACVGAGVGVVVRVAAEEVVGETV